MRITLHWNPRGVHEKSIPINITSTAMAVLFRELGDIAGDYIEAVKTADKVDDPQRSPQDLANSHAEGWIRLRVLFGRCPIPDEVNRWYEGSWRGPIFQQDPCEILRHSCLKKRPRHVPTPPPKTARIERKTDARPSDIDEIECQLETDDPMPFEPPWVDLPRRRKRRRATKPSPRPVRN